MPVCRSGPPIHDDLRQQLGVGLTPAGDSREVGGGVCGGRGNFSSPLVIPGSSYTEASPLQAAAGRGGVGGGPQVRDQPPTHLGLSPPPTHPPGAEPRVAPDLVLHVELALPVAGQPDLARPRHARLAHLRRTAPAGGGCLGCHHAEPSGAAGAAQACPRLPMPAQACPAPASLHTDLPP